MRKDTAKAICPVNRKAGSAGNGYVNAVTRTSLVHVKHVPGKRARNRRDALHVIPSHDGYVAPHGIQETRIVSTARMPKWPESVGAASNCRSGMRALIAARLSSSSARASASPMHRCAP
jgi:hypothetical protein